MNFGATPKEKEQWHKAMTALHKKNKLSKEEYSRRLKEVPTLGRGPTDLAMNNFNRMRLPRYQFKNSFLGAEVAKDIKNVLIY